MPYSDPTQRKEHEATPEFKAARRVYRATPKQRTKTKSYAQSDKGHTAHNRYHTPERNSWASMIHRCTNPVGKSKAYVDVYVCERWLKFENFLADMGSRPEGTTLGRTLDRGNYEPGNCFWMTPAAQGLSRRNNHALRKWAAQLEGEAP